METDYSKVENGDFERTVRNYAIFRLLGTQQQADESAEGTE